MTAAEFNCDAHLLRDVTNTLGLEISVRKASRLLARCATPHIVAGGFAVQERGYPRLDKELELIVPDPEQAVQILALTGEFRRDAISTTAIDNETGVAIHFLRGDSEAGGGPVRLPTPALASAEPMILGLADLISAKLSSFVAGGIARAQDAADVVELIKRTRPPRELPVDQGVRDMFLKIWDQLDSGEAQFGEWRLF